MATVAGVAGTCGISAAIRVAVALEMVVGGAFGT